MNACQTARDLNDGGRPADAVRAMAEKLPEDKGVDWAAQSARKVASPANPGDLEAIQAAEAAPIRPRILRVSSRLARLSADTRSLQFPALISALWPVSQGIFGALARP